MTPGIVTDTGDTGWVLGSAALVLFMTPGLALFYGGLVRSKNVLGTMMQSVAAIAIAPQTRHSHVGGSSASAAKGTLKWCPFGQSKATS